MTRFEWNGLALGDDVFVHRPSAVRSAAAPGTVAFVTVRGRHDNDVGIRLEHGDEPVLWPSWMAVHREPVGVAGTCWRCNEVTPATTI